MDIESTVRLITCLRENGVTHFKSKEMELTLGSDVPRGTLAQKASTTLAKLVSAPKAEPSELGAVPPTEIKVPHQLNQVASLLKLDDNALVEKLFPDYSQMEAKA